MTGTMDSPASSNPNPQRPASELVQQRRGRMTAIVTRVDTRDKGFVFAKDAEGSEYFVHRSGFNDVGLFEHVTVGDVLNFRWTQQPKGRRGYDVNRAEANDPERERLKGWFEDHGNR